MALRALSRLRSCRNFSLASHRHYLLSKDATTDRNHRLAFAGSVSGAVRQQIKPPGVEKADASQVTVELYAILALSWATPNYGSDSPSIISGRLFVRSGAIAHIELVPSI